MPQYDLTTALQDADFLKAGMTDKIAFLAAHDPDFAKAPQEEQLGYLNHLLPGGAAAVQAHEALKGRILNLPPEQESPESSAFFLQLAGTGAGLGAPGQTVARAKEILPSAERAGQAFQELKGAIGNHTVAMTDKLAGTLADIKEAVDTGSTLPSVINKFVTRIADVDEGPLTYKEARMFYHNVSELSASERMATKASDFRLIQAFKRALGDTIADTAESAGRLEQYQGAMKEFAKAQRLKEGIKTGAKIAVGLGALGGAGTTAYNLFGKLRDMAGPP